MASVVLPWNWTDPVRRGVEWCFTGSLNLLFPPVCAGCGDSVDARNDVLLCETCCCRLGTDNKPRCPRCGSQVPHVLPADSRCAGCRRGRLKFDSVTPLGVYRDELREVILRLKRPRQESLAFALGSLFWRNCGKSLADLQPDVVVPVPMHWRRRLTRGTSNPDLLAEQLARRCCAPAAHRLLKRCRNTLLQSGLSQNQRFRNVRDAFRLSSGYLLHDAKVLLVDDILTTGATCSEAARTLLSAGATSVHVAVLGRTNQIAPLR